MVKLVVLTYYVKNSRFNYIFEIFSKLTTFYLQYDNNQTTRSLIDKSHAYKWHYYDENCSYVDGHIYKYIMSSSYLNPRIILFKKNPY